MLIMLSKKIDEADKKIGANIKAARESAKLTQADIAKVLGCSQGNVAHYESGRRPVTCGMIKLIADKIGIHPSALVAPEEDGSTYGSTNPEHIELAKKAIAVIQANAHPYSESLVMNIESFYKAVESEKTTQARLTALERVIQSEGGPPHSGPRRGSTSFQKNVLPSKNPGHKT